MSLDWYLIAREQGFPDPKTMLTKLYVDEGYSINEIADHLECSSWSIRYAMDRFDIKTRPQGGLRQKRRGISTKAIETLLAKMKEAKP